MCGKIGKCNWSKLFVEILFLGYAESPILYSYHDGALDEASFKIQPGRIRTISKELLVYDANDMVGSIGGSLGLFLGFSFFGSLSNCFDKLLDLGSRFLQNRNQIVVV